MQNFLAQWMPPNYSAHGAYLDLMLGLVHWLMLVLFIGWGSFFIYTLYKFRSKKNPKASYTGARTHFSSYVEGGVAVIEIVLLLVFSIPAWYRWTRPVPASENPLIIRVVAEQFAWNIHYPGADGRFGKSDIKLISSSNPLGLDPSDPSARDDITTINQLHLELNRPVVLRLTSKDVIHSFSLPVMRAKQDVNPGQEIPIHFTPIKTSGPEDKWEIACAQLCGLGHYRMRGQFVVQTKQELQKWLAETPPALVDG
ncbi:MAG TPA: cytochrome c oxidase subunit II [Thermoanaerobaculia bacterium]|nr:cytochrome c oxidase subunit II [Thermoanaerobaculia bacterium]